MSNLRKEFSKIYDRYIDKIYRFIFLKVNSREVAEDLTSETFLRGWRAYKKSKVKSQKSKVEEIENIQAFLYQIARNLIIDHYREKGQVRIVSTEYSRPLFDPRVDLEEKTQLESDLDMVRVALANLKDDYREVIVWYYLDELSVPEIAKILDKSETAVRVMLHRALKALRTEIENKKY